MAVPDYAARLLRALPEAAMFVSARGTVEFANAEARKLLGIEVERPVDCQLSQRIDDPEGKIAETLRTWARSTHPTPGSFAIVAPGSRTMCSARGSVVLEANEHAPATLLVRFWPRSAANPFVLLNQKIAELNDEVARRTQVEEALLQSEASLRERAREAESLNRAKDEFLATVSHELRTPLHAMLGWSSLLRGRTTDQQVSKALEVIHRNAQSQAKIIDDILDVSRIISGKLRLEVSAIDLSVIIQEAVEVVRPSAAAKQIEIVATLPTDPCLLVADPDRLRQVAWNLFSNAVKFTGPNGKVQIDLSQKASRFVLSVSDTGQGIEASFLPHVFDRFKQADGSTTRRTGGLGLGLALVRHIVELHGGTVDAFSEGVDKGATFALTLPIRAVAPTEAHLSSEPHARSVIEPTAPTPGVLQGYRILVVDDEPDARELVGAVLRQAGGAVETASSAAEAYDAVFRVRPHVIVSDIGLPEEDGYSFMRRLRKVSPKDGGSIPSVALTAYTRVEDRSQALAAGFNTHIGKPVDIAELVTTVVHLAALPPDDLTFLPS